VLAGDPLAAVEETERNRGEKRKGGSSSEVRSSVAGAPPTSPVGELPREVVHAPSSICCCRIC
jgi:hypothetical protein